MRKHTMKILLFLFMLTTLSGAAMGGPDGILSPGNSSLTIADAIKALRIAVKIDPQPANTLAHGAVAPIVKGNPTVS